MHYLLFVCDGQRRFLNNDYRLMGHPARRKSITFTNPMELRMCWTNTLKNMRPTTIPHYKLLL